MNVRPPGRVTLLWCPACGRTDVTTAKALSKASVHVGELGGTCLGERQLVEYVIPRVPEPLPAMTEGVMSAAVAVEIAIRPAPTHLAKEPLAFVGRTVQFRAHTVDQVAELAGLVLRDIATGIPESIAAHPRPEPEGWADGLLPERTWRHEHRD